MAELCDGAKQECRREAVRRLQKGESVALPTETVYGLAARYDVPSAVSNVFLLKGRPSDNPLIVHVADFNAALKIGKFNDVSMQLAEKFWPGPLTIVVPRRPGVLDVVTAGLDTVAIRCPKHNVFLSILRVAGPLVAPSANVSGRPSPSRAQHVMNDFMEEDVLVVDGGPCQIGLESTVVSVNDNGEITVLRPGSITRAELAEFGCVNSGAESDSNAAPASPGMKYRHYAPNAEVVIVGSVSDIKRLSGLHARETMVLLSTSDYEQFETRHDFASVERLTTESLYEQMRRADDMGLQKIICVCSGEIGQNEALMNRLHKARTQA